MIREQAKFAIMLGDQVYADEDGQAWQRCMEIDDDDPDSHSRRTAIYRGLYSKYWNIPDVKNVMANFPCYMIWDDHDITNGWGSSSSHREDKEQNVFRVARQAYIDFQHSHNPHNTLTPSALYYGFRVGCSAFIALDLRGHRQVWNSQLLGQAQKDWLEDFMTTSCRDAKVLFIISSVPVFHLDARWAWIPYPDITDQWSDEHNKGDRKWLMQRLFDWIKEDHVRQVVILGGDVHVGTFATVTILDERGEPTGDKIIQATSSPISNKAASFIDIFQRKASASFDTETESGQKIHVDISPRYPARNFLMVTVDSTSDPDKPTVRFKMHWEGKKNPDPYPGEQGHGGFFNFRGRRFR